MEKITLPAGFEDILPDQAGKWKFAAKTIEKVFRRFSLPNY